MEALFLFWQLVQAGFGVDCWMYTNEGEYLNCSVADDSYLLLFLDRVFTSTGCKQTMLDYFSTHQQPLVLSAPLGFTWLADIQITEQGTRIHHVLGPVLASEVSEENALQRFAAFQPELAEVQGHWFILLLKNLPVLPQMLIQRLALMLHNFTTNEKVTIEEITYQSGFMPSALQTNSPENIMEWGGSSHLMELVRNGNVHAAHDFTLAGTGNTLQHLQFMAVATLAFSAHASIEGGLPADIVNELAGLYTQSISECHSFQEVQMTTRTILEDFTNRVYRCHRKPPLSKEIQSCCEYIQFHIDSHLTVENLADRLGYAKYYLTQKFKKETGQNIRDYIRAQKIERAKFLLQNSPMSIQEISSLLCFSSCSYFATVFRELVGISPQEYRKANGVCM